MLNCLLCEVRAVFISWLYPLAKILYGQKTLVKEEYAVKGAVTHRTQSLRSTIACFCIVYRNKILLF